jgi:hypothetical protein
MTMKLSDFVGHRRLHVFCFTLFSPPPSHWEPRTVQVQLLDEQDSHHTQDALASPVTNELNNAIATQNAAMNRMTLHYEQQSASHVDDQRALSTARSVATLLTNAAQRQQNEHPSPTQQEFETVYAEIRQVQETLDAIKKAFELAADIAELANDYRRRKLKKLNFLLGVAKALWKAEVIDPLIVMTADQLQDIMPRELPTYDSATTPEEIRQVELNIRSIEHASPDSPEWRNWRAQLAELSTLSAEDTQQIAEDVSDKIDSMPQLAADAFGLPGIREAKTILDIIKEERAIKQSAEKLQQTLTDLIASLEGMPTLWAQDGHEKTMNVVAHTVNLAERAIKRRLVPFLGHNYIKLEPQEKQKLSTYNAQLQRYVHPEQAQKKSSPQKVN